MRVRRLVCTFVIRKPQRQGFFLVEVNKYPWPYLKLYYPLSSFWKFDATFFLFFLHSYFYFIWFTMYYLMYVPNSWLTEGSEQFSRAPFSAVFDRRNNRWISLLSIRSPVSWSNQVVVLVFLCPDPVAPLVVVVRQHSLHIIHLKLYYNLEYLPAHSILVHITYACICFLTTI